MGGHTGNRGPYRKGGHTGKGEIIQEMEDVMLRPVREDHPIWCAYPHLLLPAATSSSNHEKLGNIQSTNPFFFSSLICAYSLVRAKWVLCQMWNFLWERLPA